MKKILALVLAVAMLSTVAFATGTLPAVTVTNPGETYTLDASDFGITVGGPLDTNYANFPLYEFNSDNFTVSVKYGKGADLVKSVAFNNDDNVVEFKLNSNNTLVRPASTKADNLSITSITVKAKRTVKSGSSYVLKSGVSYKYEPATAQGIKVGYEVKEVKITEAASLTSGQMAKFIAVSGDNTQVAEVSYDAGANFLLEGKVYVGDKVFFKSSTSYSDAAKAIAKANEDATIENTRITLEGLSASHKIILNAEKDSFVYKVVDGKLAPSGLTWNEDEYAFVGKIRSTTEYIVSDMELKGVTTTTPDTTNPDTGANDVVGIAAALAVVSLVAAGAVSLKK